MFGEYNISTKAKRKRKKVKSKQKTEKVKSKTMKSFFEVEHFRANAMQLAWSAMFWGVAPLPGNGYTLSNPLLSFDPDFSGTYAHFWPTTFAIRAIRNQRPILWS